MLQEIVNVISSHNSTLKDGTLFINNITVTDGIQKCIRFLEDNGAIENVETNFAIGRNVNLELTIARLNGIGYYETAEALVRKNVYEYPSNLCYVQDLDKYSNEDHEGFFKNYKTTIEFIDSIKHIAKYTFQEVDIQIAVIFREDKSLILPFTYTPITVLKMSEEDAISINYVTGIFRGEGSHEKLIFINELIDNFVGEAENYRFNKILGSASEFKKRSISAFQYYLRDFSFNKLKIELDSKALEFTQKIQSVINDSQSKLIAIPTAFVLVFAAFDFTDVWSVKDVTSIIGLFVFAMIIQVFLNNQYSALNFTSANIESYKTTFKEGNTIKYSDKFGIVDKELIKQKTRLNLVVIMLWCIPSILTLIWAFLLYSEYQKGIKTILETLVFFIRMF